MTAMLRRLTLLALTTLMLSAVTPRAAAQSAEMQLVITQNGGPGGQLVIAVQARQSSLATTTAASGTIDIAYDPTRLSFLGVAEGVLTSGKGYGVSGSSITDPGATAACTGTFARTSVTSSNVGTGFGQKAGHVLDSAHETLFSVGFNIAAEALGTDDFTFCPRSLNLSFYDDVQNSDGDGGTIEAEPTGGDLPLAYVGITEAPLPVELTQFEAAADGEAVVLRWQTASETNNVGFAVERAAAPAASAHNAQAEEGEQAEAEELVWEEVAFVEGQGTTVEAQAYAQRVEDVAFGRHLFRLRQVDADGTSHYSSEVEVLVELATALLVESPYPNPFRETAVIRFGVREAAPVRVEAYDALGRLARVLYDGVPVAQEMQSVRLEASGLTSGLYVVRVQSGEHVRTQRVLLVK